MFVLSSVVGAGGFELGRNEYQNTGAGNEQALWNRHDGLTGLINNHMGDMWETIGMFYVLLGPVNIFCNAFEKMMDKSISPATRVLATSIISSLTVAALEMNSGMSAVSEWRDALIGPLIGLTCLNLSELASEQVVNKDGLNRMGKLMINATEKMGKLPDLISDFTKKLKLPGM